MLAAQLRRSLSPATCRQKNKRTPAKTSMTHRRAEKNKKGIFKLRPILLQRRGGGGRGAFVRAYYYKVRIFMPSHVFPCQSVDAWCRRLSWSAPVAFRLFIFSIRAASLCCQIKLPRSGTLCNAGLLVRALWCSHSLWISPPKGNSRDNCVGVWPVMKLFRTFGAFWKSLRRTTICFFFFKKYKSNDRKKTTTIFWVSTVPR